MKKQAKKRIQFNPWRVLAYAAIVVAVAGAVTLGIAIRNRAVTPPVATFADTPFGDYLAAQHALAADDFSALSDFYEKIPTDVKSDSVLNSRATAMFIAGKLDESAATLAGDAAISAQIAYAAYLAQTGDWDKIYTKFRKNDSEILAPIRIWSGIATKHITDTNKFIDGLSMPDNWKNFTRGMILAETGNPNSAAARFASVDMGFLNLNDYLYIMAFYDKNNMADAAKKLYDDYTARAGGVYMLNYTKPVKYADYGGYGRALGFSLLQSISHSPMLSMTNLPLLFMRLAAAAGIPDTDEAWNYYMGAFFYDNKSPAANEFFNHIGQGSLYYPFVMLKRAETAANLRDMRRDLNYAVRENPLFLPAIIRITDLDIQMGRADSAAKIISNALKNKQLTTSGRVFLLVARARTYRMAKNYGRANNDVNMALSVSPNDGMALAERARIQIAQNKNIDDAYTFALALVHKFPMDVGAWDLLGTAVERKEGAAAALDLVGKVGRVASENSALFMHIGDYSHAVGNDTAARAAYLRAIDLSGDGLSVRSEIQGKLKKIK